MHAKKKDDRGKLYCFLNFFSHRMNKITNPGNVTSPNSRRVNGISKRSIYGLSFSINHSKTFRPVGFLGIFPTYQ